MVVTVVGNAKGKGGEEEEGGSSAGLDVHQPPASWLDSPQRSRRTANKAHSLLLTYLDDGGHGAKGGGKYAEVKRGDDQEDDPTKRKALHFSKPAPATGEAGTICLEKKSRPMRVLRLCFVLGVVVKCTHEK